LDGFTFANMYEHKYLIRLKVIVQNDWKGLFHWL